MNIINSIIEIYNKLEFKYDDIDIQIVYNNVNKTNPDTVRIQNLIIKNEFCKKFAKRTNNPVKYLKSNRLVVCSTVNNYINDNGDECLNINKNIYTQLHKYDKVYNYNFKDKSFYCIPTEQLKSLPDITERPFSMAVPIKYFNYKFDDKARYFLTIQKLLEICKIHNINVDKGKLYLNQSEIQLLE